MPLGSSRSEKDTHVAMRFLIYFGNFIIQDIPLAYDLYLRLSGNGYVGVMTRLCDCYWLNSQPLHQTSESVDVCCYGSRPTRLEARKLAC